MTAQDNKNALIDKTNRKRKSIRLAPNERTQFKKYAKSFNTIQDCADKLGLYRQTITRILASGTCGQETYNMLQQKEIITAQA